MGGASGPSGPGGSQGKGGTSGLGESQEKDGAGGSHGGDSGVSEPGRPQGKNGAGVQGESQGKDVGPSADKGITHTVSQAPAAAVQATQSPSAAPSESATKPLAPQTKAPPLTASSSGDPHFKLWNGDRWDFHGGCDLVLFENPSFADGRGLVVHIRTKVNTWWSYIDTAVVSVGNFTLEVAGGLDGGVYWMNGRSGKIMEDGDLLDRSLSGFLVKYRFISDKQKRYRIDLGNGDAIALDTYKSFVSVNMKANSPNRFEGSAGLMGSYPDGRKMARDGKTVMEDAVDFGKHWQVRLDEPHLFHNVEGPQHPTECAMPLDKSVDRRKRRRLGEKLITEEDAAIACARVDKDDGNACIFDVLATNDKGIAGSY